jgi:hypothetical protein
MFGEDIVSRIERPTDVERAISAFYELQTYPDIYFLMGFLGIILKWILER